jgi:hypothetical protein
MRSRISLAAAIAAIACVSAPAAFANHSWNGYHWARTANPFTLQLGRNLTTAEWQSHLNQTSSDWSKASVLDTSIVAGQARNKNCRPTAGRDEICNGSYGNNGWLGVATIWLQSGTKHIVQGTVKVNDYYLGPGASYVYNNSAEREHVMCQEVGHTFGLDHQDESGASLNTCMDYYHNTSSSDTTSTRPNQHDYDELGTIYGHLDASTTVGATPASHLVPTGQIGESRYVEGLANGLTRVIYVRWATPIHTSL